MAREEKMEWYWWFIIYLCFGHIYIAIQNRIEKNSDNLIKDPTDIIMTAIFWFIIFIIEDLYGTIIKKYLSWIISGFGKHKEEK
jgi:hypothetical protein